MLADLLLEDIAIKLQTF